eukprot:3551801-Lingulodinium_polyedra.AAC.1
MSLRLYLRLQSLFRRDCNTANTIASDCDCIAIAKRFSTHIAITGFAIIMATMAIVIALRRA